MFIITAQQVEEFGTLAQAAFRSRACTFIQGVCPELATRFDNAALQALISYAHAHAQSNGVSSERGVMKWIVLSLVLGKFLHTAPEVSNLLDAEDGGSAERKIEQLFAEVAVQLRAVGAAEWR